MKLDCGAIWHFPLCDLCEDGRTVRRAIFICHFPLCDLCEDGRTVRRAIFIWHLTTMNRNHL